MKRPASNAAPPIDPRMLSNWQLPLPLFDIVTANNWLRLSSARTTAASGGYPFLWTPRTVRFLKPTLALIMEFGVFVGVILVAREFTKPNGQVSSFGIAAMLGGLLLMFLPRLFLGRGTLLFFRRPTAEAAYLKRLNDGTDSPARIGLAVRRALARSCRDSEDIIRPDETHLSLWPSSGVMLHEFCIYISESLDCTVNPIQLAEKLRLCERRTIGDLVRATAAALAVMESRDSGNCGSVPLNNQGNGLHGAPPSTISTKLASFSDRVPSNAPKPGAERELCYESFACQRRHLPQLRIRLPQQFIRPMLRYAFFTALLILPAPILIAAFFPYVPDPWQMTIRILASLLPGVALLSTVAFLVYYALLMLTLSPVTLRETEVRFATPEQRFPVSEIHRVEVGDALDGRRKVAFFSPHGSRTIAMPTKTDIRRLESALRPNCISMSQPQRWHPQFTFAQDQEGIIQNGTLKWPEPFIRGFGYGEAARFFRQTGLMTLLAIGVLATAITTLAAIAHRSPTPLFVFSSIVLAVLIASSITVFILATFQRYTRPEIFRLEPEWIDVGVRGFPLSDARQITLKIHRWRGPMLHIHFPDHQLDLALPNTPEIVQKTEGLLRSGPAASRVLVN